jgi:hypothetical protein
MILHNNKNHPGVVTDAKSPGSVVWPLAPITSLSTTRLRVYYRTKESDKDALQSYIYLHPSLTYHVKTESPSQTHIYSWQRSMPRLLPAAATMGPRRPVKHRLLPL